MVVQKVYLLNEVRMAMAETMSCGHNITLSGAKHACVKEGNSTYVVLETFNLLGIPLYGAIFAGDLFTRRQHVG